MRTFESFMQNRPDMEGLMVKAQLEAIIEECQKIKDMLQDDTELPAWIQSKIAVSQNSVNEIYYFMKMMAGRTQSSDMWDTSSVETSPTPSVDVRSVFPETTPDTDEVPEQPAGLESYEDFIKDENKETLEIEDEEPEENMEEDEEPEED